MNKKLCALALATVVASSLIVGCGGGPQKPADKKAPAGKDSKKLIIYTSMKENLIKGIVEGFKKKNPGIEVDYQSAGAGKLMAKIAAERQSGKILADVIWTSEVPDFYKMKSEGILATYKSPVAKETINPFKDYDGSFHAARLGTLGIIINTDKIKQAPTSWNDLLKPEYKGKFGIADPALSGTSFMSVTLLQSKFGWEFFQKIKGNGGRIGKGSGQVVDDTSSGELSASLAVDYIANGKIAKGAHMQLCYPKELLVIPSPVAIFKDSTKKDAAQKFVDYLLGKEAQTLVAGQGTIPVREDVPMPNKYFKLPKPKDALAQAIPCDYQKAVKEKEATIKKFTEIMKK